MNATLTLALECHVGARLSTGSVFRSSEWASLSSTATPSVRSFEGTRVCVSVSDTGGGVSDCAHEMASEPPAAEVAPTAELARPCEIANAYRAASQPPAASVASGPDVADVDSSEAAESWVQARAGTDARPAREKAVNASPQETKPWVQARAGRASQDPASPVHADVDSPDVDAREADPAAQEPARSRGAGQALASATEHVAATALTAVLLVQLVRTVLCTILFTILGALVGSACKSLAQLLSPSEGGGGRACTALPACPALPRVSMGTGRVDAELQMKLQMSEAELQITYQISKAELTLSKAELQTERRKGAALKAELQTERRKRAELKACTLQLQTMVTDMQAAGRRLIVEKQDLQMQLQTSKAKIARWRRRCPRYGVYGDVDPVQEAYYVQFAPEIRELQEALQHAQEDKGKLQRDNGRLLHEIDDVRQALQRCGVVDLDQEYTSRHLAEQYVSDANYRGWCEGYDAAGGRDGSFVEAEHTALKQRVRELEQSTTAATSTSRGGDAAAGQAPSEGGVGAVDLGAVAKQLDDTPLAMDCTARTEATAPPGPYGPGTPPPGLPSIHWVDSSAAYCQAAKVTDYLPCSKGGGGEVPIVPFDVGYYSRAVGEPADDAVERSPGEGGAGGKAWPGIPCGSTDTGRVFAATTATEVNGPAQAGSAAAEADGATKELCAAAEPQAADGVAAAEAGGAAQAGCALRRKRPNRPAARRRAAG